MIKTSYDYRVLCIIFALLLAFMLFAGPASQSSYAVVVATSTAIVAIVIAGLAAMGITFTMTGGYQTVEGWMSGVIEDSGIDFTGVKYGSNAVGNILLSNRFVSSLVLLAQYIRARYGLQDNATTAIISPSVSMGEVYLYELPVFMPYDRLQYEWTYYVTTGVTYAAIAGSNSPSAFWFISPVSGNQIVRYTKNASTGVITNEVVHAIDTQIGNYYVYKAESYNASRWQTAGYTAYNTVAELNAALENDEIAETTEMLNAVTGSISIPTVNDEGGVISLPVPWGSTLSGTLADVPDLVLENELAGNTDLTLQPEGTVADQISDTATNSPYVGSNPDDYRVLGLQDVFPFCIPFDVYHLLSALAADPVAPAFTWRFYVPGLCDESINVDLSPFNTAAQVLRTMELLAFIIGLAMVTREKFLRG